MGIPYSREEESQRTYNYLSYKIPPSILVMQELNEILLNDNSNLGRVARRHIKGPDYASGEKIRLLEHELDNAESTLNNLIIELDFLHEDLEFLREDLELETGYFNNEREQEIQKEIGVLNEKIDKLAERVSELKGEIDFENITNLKDRATLECLTSGAINSQRDISGYICKRLDSLVSSNPNMSQYAMAYINFMQKCVKHFSGIKTAEVKYESICQHCLKNLDSEAPNLSQDLTFIFSDDAANIIFKKFAQNPHDDCTDTECLYSISGGDLTVGLQDGSEAYQNDGTFTENYNPCTYVDNYEIPIVHLYLKKLKTPA